LEKKFKTLALISLKKSSSKKINQHLKLWGKKQISKHFAFDTLES
jgi:hypothetical protein